MPTHPIQYQMPIGSERKNIDAHIFPHQISIKPKMDKDFNKKFAWIQYGIRFKYKIIGSNKNDVNNFLLIQIQLTKKLKRVGLMQYCIRLEQFILFKSIFYVFYSKKLILRAEITLKKEK